MKPKLLWITDPWDTLDHAKDTTLRLAEECLRLDVETHWCDLRTIRWQEDQVLLDSRKIEGIYPGRAPDAFRLGPAVPTPPSQFTQIHYRTDPPVDLAYTQPLQILLLGLGTGTEVVNPISLLLTGNEKLEGASLGDWMPTSVSSSQLDPLLDFAKREGRAVLKPLHNAQSKGVELLDCRTDEGTERARDLLESSTESFTRPVLLQRYLEGIREGEQRLWFIDGRLLACVRKRPASGQFRIDMDQGGSLARTELSPREQKAAAAIGRHLKARKIRLAAVDLIEGFVTDFNFTSPGLIVGMEAILGENLARPIIEELVRQV